MLILAARYAFIFWAFIGSNNGDTLLMRNMEGEDQNNYRISACTARCLLHEQQQQHELQEQQKLHGHHQSHRPAEHPSMRPFENPMFLQNCYDACRTDNRSSWRSEKMRKIPENFHLKLVCRDDRSLTFRIDNVGRAATATATSTATRTAASATLPTTPPSSASTSRLSLASAVGWTAVDHRDAATDAIVFVIKVHVAREAKEYSVYLSDENFFVIHELLPNTTYNISTVAVHANNEYSVIAKGLQYTTLRRGYTPGMVQNIQVKNFSADEANDMRLTAKITWKPPADMTCHYNIICFSPESAEYDMTPLEIRNPRQLYTYTLENLTFSSVYKIGIRAKNTNNFSKESELYWEMFRAPSCLEWYNYNFNICAPLVPEGLEVEQIVVGENVYSLNVTWLTPEHYPSYYTVRVLDLAENGSSYSMNATKMPNSVFFSKITLRGMMYEVHLTAYTPGGSASTVVTDLVKRLVVMPDKHHFVKLIAAILAPIFCIAILSLTTFIICHRRAKLRRYQERCKYFEELEKKAPIDPKATFEFPPKSLPLTLTSPEDLTQLQLDLDLEKVAFNDAMEIDRSHVTLHEVLGEGAFGLVRRGIYQDDKLGPKEVAVKMLKDQPTVDDVRAFRREIEVMKSVERHPNIVGIIGHCTRRHNEMMLLTEYCSFGNLLHFLRSEWKFLHELSFQSDAMTIRRTTSTPVQQQQRSQRQVQQQQQRKRPASGHKARDGNNVNGSNDNRTGQANGNSINNSNSKNNNNNNNNNRVFHLDAAIIEKIKKKYKNLNGSSNGSVCVTKDVSSSISTTRATTTTTTTIAALAGDDMQYIEEVATTPTTPTTPTTSTTTTASASASAADNKSYGYDEICTNACKCQVDVVRIKDIDPSCGNQEVEQLERALQRRDGSSGEAATAGRPPTLTSPTGTATTTINSHPIKSHNSANSGTVSSIRIRSCNCRVLVKNSKNSAQLRAATTTTAPRALSVENKGYYKFLTENLRAKRGPKALPKTESTGTTAATTPTTATTSAATTNELSSRSQDGSPETSPSQAGDYDDLQVPEESDNEHEQGDNHGGDDNLLIGSVRREPLSASDLLDIARQVAVGMEFLAKNKVVHRDLAARNVLVAPDRTIKIADFGLSRDVYQENIYKKTGNGKLPIKWLALESMTHQVYTTQSDVWSYGILMYEIATLGGIPYPSIPTNRLLHLLKSGYRMEKPKNCGQEFYNLMFSCWNVNPGERPNFTQIIKILENLMSDAPQRQIENLILPKAPRAAEVSSEDAYLKPL